MIKLYTFPPSTNSRKVRIALIEKGLEFERINVDLTKGEQKNAEYLQIHPFGQIPALDDEGFIVYDSTIINEYLEDEYPYPSLMPPDSEGRARARMMEDFRDSNFNPYFVHIIHEMRKPEGERDAARIDNAKAEIDFVTLPSRPSSERGGIGVYLGTMPDYGADAEGVRVAAVANDSPAARAGLREGDVIVKLAEANIHNIEDLTSALQSRKPGDEVEIVVLRMDQPITLKATLQSRS